MATRKLTLQYGLLAVVLAIGIIGTSMYFHNSGNQEGTTNTGQTSFFVMLTDPPTVPYGTTELNVTYSSIQLNVVPNSGSSYWVAAQESGRVNLLSLVNVTQTIASVNLPTGATVDKLQLKLSSAEAKISGEVYPVTLLSDNLLISIKATKLNGTKTGALIDLHPTLLEIDATNSTGGHISYYVLSPSANAVVKSNMTDDQCKVGSKWRMREEENKRLEKEYRSALNNITVTKSSLSVNGNVTTLSVTLKNIGKSNATIPYLSLSGEFNITSPYAATIEQNGYPGHGTSTPTNTHNNRWKMFQWPTMMGRPEVIPFTISEGKLIPIFGDRTPMTSVKTSHLILKPGESATLTYNGVISLNVDGRYKNTHVAVTPIKANSYMISLMGLGFKTFTVNAS